MNSINIPIISKEIKTENIQLRASWTREMQKDLNVYHNLDVADFPRVFYVEQRRLIRKDSIKKIFN
jgi:hypothetical protein